MQNKITYEKVKEDFGERGYDLISSEYKNTKTPLVYICRKHKNRGEQKIDYEHLKKNKVVYIALMNKDDKSIKFQRIYVESKLRKMDTYTSD